MPSSDEIKDLCVEEFPESKSKDWKRIHKFKVDCAGIVRVFQNKVINKFITVVYDGDEIYFTCNKMSNKPSDYIFSVYTDPDSKSLPPVAFIQPKYGEGYDQENILSYCVKNPNSLGLWEDTEAEYCYRVDGKVQSTDTLKAKLIELGLEYDPTLGAHEVGEDDDT